MAGRLSPARITVINYCASGWQSRQQIVTMVNSGADDKNNSRDKSNPPTGDGSPIGRARGRCLRFYAALRLRPQPMEPSTKVIPRRGTGAREGERGGVLQQLLNCRQAWRSVSPSKHLVFFSWLLLVFSRLTGFCPLCGLLLFLTSNLPLCAISERLRAKIIAYA